MKLSIITLMLAIMVMTSGCERDNSSRFVMGYIPIYAENLTDNVKLNQAPRTLKNPGKIYIYQDYLLVIERGQGIHIIHNADPTSPSRVVFHQIPGCSEMAVRNNTLYLEYAYGILTVDISSPENARLMDFVQYDIQVPTTPDPMTSIRNRDGQILFQCPDPKDRDLHLIGWYYDKIQGTYCTSW